MDLAVQLDALGNKTCKVTLVFSFQLFKSLSPDFMHYDWIMLSRDQYLVIYSKRQLFVREPDAVTRLILCIRLQFSEIYLRKVFKVPMPLLL